MAREYGKILTRVWADQDFKQLSGRAQRLYFQLISQPDMSMAGVVTLAEKRWSLQVADQNQADVEAALRELEQARFVVVDRSTQEVLIRSFIRSDGGWRSPTAMKGIDSSARSILSDGLKGVIRTELEKVDTSTLSTAENKNTHRSTREVVEGIVWGILEDFNGLPDMPCDTASDTPSGCHIEISHSTETETATATATEPETESSRPGTKPKAKPKVLPWSEFAEAHPDAAKALDHLSDLVEQNGFSRPKRNKDNLDAARLLFERDKRDPWEVRRVIDWATSDSFWRTNIQSMVKFRHQYEMLRAKMKASQPPEEDLWAREGKF